MYYLETDADENTRFRNAVVVALAVHAALIFSISFDGGRPSPSTSQIEVTLANRPSTDAPDDASHIAQANQQGSGEEADLNQITSASTLPAPAPAPTQTLPEQRSAEATVDQDVLVTNGVAQRVTNSKPEESAAAEPPKDGISPEVDRISAELASLQAEFDEQTRSYADKPRVRRLTAVSARQSADAAYLLDWRRRLEAVGNKYYPQASVRYGIYGDVRLLVIIRKDGSLEDVKVLSSSGFAVLDEAAIKVVRMAAPYSPFPPELAATTDKLEIIRTWQYLQNELSSEKALQANAASR